MEHVGNNFGHSAGPWGAEWAVWLLKIPCFCVKYSLVLCAQKNVNGGMMLSRASRRVVVLCFVFCVVVASPPPLFLSAVAHKSLGIASYLTLATYIIKDFILLQILSQVPRENDQIPFPQCPRSTPSHHVVVNHHQSITGAALQSWGFWGSAAGGLFSWASPCHLPKGQGMLWT